MTRKNGMMRVAGTAAVLALAGVASAQMLVDTMAATGVSDSLAAGSVSGGMNPTMLTGRADAAVGAANNNMAATNASMGGVPGGPMMPGAPPLPGTAPVPGDIGGGYPGAPGGAAPPLPGAAPGMPGQPGVPGQPGAAPTPTPIPMINVLEGERVYDAVTGALLEDAVVVPQPVTEQDNYFDDGIRDNGIAGDGVRGNVKTTRDQYIGAETNGLKNRAIRVVRTAESMTPMEFFGYHVATTNPRDGNPRMPKFYEKEKQQDDLLADWNNKFLADFRVDKDNPQSKFFDLYVPRPPQAPRYPIPPGYVSPQKMQEGGGQPGAPGAGAAPNIWNGDAVIGVPGEGPGGTTPI